MYCLPLNTVRHSGVNHPMNPLRVLLWSIVFGFLLSNVASVSAFAEERQFPEHNFAITLPTGWEELKITKPQPGMVAAFSNANKSRMIFVMVDHSARGDQAMGDEFVAQLESGAQAGGMGKRISGKFIEVEGLKSYERVGSLAVGGNEMSLVMRAIPVKGGIYGVQGMRANGDVTTDSEIQKVLDSFRFLSPPIPVSATAAGSEKTAAYRIGYTLGKLACPIGLFVGIVAIVWVIVKMVRGKGAPR